MFTSQERKLKAKMAERRLRWVVGMLGRCRRLPGRKLTHIARFEHWKLIWVKYILFLKTTRRMSLRNFEKLDVEVGLKLEHVRSASTCALPPGFCKPTPQIHQRYELFSGNVLLLTHGPDGSIGSEDDYNFCSPFNACNCRQIRTSRSFFSFARLAFFTSPVSVLSRLCVCMCVCVCVCTRARSQCTDGDDDNVRVCVYVCVSVSWKKGLVFVLILPSRRCWPRELEEIWEYLDRLSTKPNVCADWRRLQLPWLCVGNGNVET